MRFRPTLLLPVIFLTIATFYVFQSHLRTQSRRLERLAITAKMESELSPRKDKENTLHALKNEYRKPTLNLSLKSEITKTKPHQKLHVSMYNNTLNLRSVKHSIKSNISQPQIPRSNRDKTQSKQREQSESHTDTITSDQSIIPHRSNAPGKSKAGIPAWSSHGIFQRVNDNLTYVYSGYYDDTGKDAVVKVVTVTPRNITYNFTCIVHYPDRTVVRVVGYIKYLLVSCVVKTVKHRYENGLLICPVTKSKGRPSFLSLNKEGREFPKTNISIRAPSGKRNNITQCNQPFLRKYNNVTQLVWNVELLRIFGVDKFIFYLDSQDKRVLDMLHSYEKEGIVEIRNISIHHPIPEVKKFLRSIRNWAQFAANNDCLMSQVDSAKYVLFTDLDEVVVTRRHQNYVEMADDLFSERLKDAQHTGSLVFRNVYFPGYFTKTKVKYRQKELALKYKIDPLLYTIRMRISDIRISPKSLVRPQTVEVMCVHQVEKYRPGWGRKIVDEDVATLHHYRQNKPQFMYPPKSRDDYMLGISKQLITAVKKRFDSVGMEP